MYLQGVQEVTVSLKYMYIKIKHDLIDKLTFIDLDLLTFIEQDMHFYKWKLHIKKH